jgi:pimeloyl-ACP methyl ester carboxylesterase
MEWLDMKNTPSSVVVDRSRLILVLLPGMDGTGALFANFVNALHDAFETVTVSYPVERFLSYSELSDLVRASCPLFEPYMIVAESFSTPLAIQYAATKPANLTALVLCAGFSSSPIHGCRRFLGLLIAPIVFRIALPKYVARFWLLGLNAQLSLLETVRVVVSSVQPKVLAARLRAVLSCDARAELGEVAVPILYIQATQDRLVSASCLEEIQRIKPQTAVIVLDGPHLLLQQEHQRAAEVVADFVRQVTVPSGAR